MRDKKTFAGKTITRRFGKEYQLHGHIADEIISKADKVGSFEISLNKIRKIRNYTIKKSENNYLSN